MYYAKKQASFVTKTIKWYMNNKVKSIKPYDGGSK